MIRLALIAATLAGIAAAAAGAWGIAYKAGRDACKADQAETERIVSVAVQAANVATAEAISRIQIRNTTIRQELEREVQIREVFRDCRSGPDAVRLLNDTIGAGTGPKPSDPSVPPTSPAD